MSDFLQQKIGPKPGPIILQDGTVVGQHQGAYQFTVGQRRGIGLHFQCYVTRVDIPHNTVVVTKKLDDNELFRDIFPLHAMHWISGQQPALPLDCMCKVRYRQELQHCQVDTQGGNIIVHTKAPQKGVPNGQICVLYG